MDGDRWASIEIPHPSRAYEPSTAETDSEHITLYRPIKTVKIPNPFLDADTYRRRYDYRAGAQWLPETLRLKAHRVHRRIRGRIRGAHANFFFKKRIKCPDIRAVRFAETAAGIIQIKGNKIDRLLSSRPCLAPTDERWLISDRNTRC